MHYGLTIFPTEYSIQPDELAREAEARGFESLWFPEHTHIPASRISAWPGGGPLPQEYYDTYDPFVALSFAAAATKRIKLGTGICLMVERDPITTAKEVASLDRLSQGRFLFGIGGGWNAEEMANHGTRFDQRFEILRERIEAMKAIWTQEQASYAGEHVKFDAIIANPKPFTKPHPPIHLGGEAPWAIKRAVRYADGWMPIGLRGPAETYVKDLREAAVEAGRDPDSLEMSLFGTPTSSERLQPIRDAGFQRVIFFLPAAPREEILPKLDRYAELMRTVG